MKLLLFLLITLSTLFASECLKGNQFTTITLKTNLTSDIYVGLPKTVTLKNIIVIVHNEQFNLIDKGLYASDGIRQLILAGKMDKLMNELNNNHLNSSGDVVISNIKLIESMEGEGELTFTIPSTPDTPLVTIYAYIKDSPDWILVAVDQLLCSGRETIISLNIWDAGVVDGQKFGEVGQEAQLPVSLLNPTPFFYPKSNSKAFPAPLNVYIKNNQYSPCNGNDRQKYLFEFKGQWTNDKYIPYPSNAGFSRALLVTHNSTFSMFSLNGYLSPGLTDLILQNNKTLLMQELDSPDVYQFFFNDTHIYNGTETYKLEFISSKDYHFLSFFAQLNGSPDWIIGSNYINLCNDDGWVKELKYESVIYDGGVNNALTFGSSEIITSPQTIILRKQSTTNSLQNVDTSFEDLVPVANVLISKTENDDGITYYSFMILLGIICIFI